MAAFVIAMLAGAAFTGASLMAWRLPSAAGRAQSMAVAVAAGILIALAFGDLFPEALEEAADGAIVGFIAGFALPPLVEGLTRAHTHHGPTEHVGHHAVLPFIVGLAIHNVADGFALAIGGHEGGAIAGAVGVGVLVHQVPVAVSLAAVLAADRVSRGVLVRVAIGLGLAIPLGAVVAELASPGDEVGGVMTSIGAGILAYVGAAHLLPEARREHPDPRIVAVFAGTLGLMTLALLTVLGE